MPRRWSDEQLRTALAYASSVGELHALLGLKRCGSTSQRLRRRAEDLGLDISLWWASERRHRNTEAELRDAIASSATIAAALRQLGLVACGGNYEQLRKYAKLYEIDTSHWRASPSKRHVDWKDEQLRTAVAESTSMTATLKRLGVTSRRRPWRRIQELGLDTSHWLGQAHLKGKRAPWVTARRRPLEALLVAGSTTSNTHLRRRLIDEGILPYRCATCGIADWQGQPLTLHLDHVNGDRADNRLENLRLLCPNCHSQTKTYCGRNWGRYSSGVAGGLRPPAPPPSRP
jgi:hypothetical protein